MKLEFNTLGVLVNTENTSIRQGSKGNEIIAEFDGFSNLTHVAKINISRPDGSHIDNIVMNPIPSIQNSFKLTLNDVWYSAISGTASLTIYLYDGNGNIVANGQVNFDIEESDYYEEQGTITPEQYDYLLEQVAQAQASQKEYSDNGNVVEIASDQEEISDEEYEVLNHLNSKVRVDSETLFYKGNSGEEDIYLRYYNLLPQSVKKENGETVLQLETILINENKEISFTNTEIVIDTDNCIELTSNAGVLSTAKINALKKNNAYIKYNNYYYRKRNVVVNGDQQTLYFTRERFENPTANSFQVVTEMFNISTSNRSYAFGTSYHPSVYTTAYINNVVSALNDSISASGHSLDLQSDESNYEYTIRLKDSNNNVLSSVKINLPLESIVLGAQYYEEYTYGGTTYEKVIVITLATSDVPVIIPVGDLVSGLVSTDQLNTALATKVNKMGFQHPNNDFAYIQEANGNEGALPISLEPSMGAIPKRDISGGIIVQETPTNNQHATSKKYVDDNLNLKANKVGPLPSFDYDNNAKVYDFVINNNINDKPIVFNLNSGMFEGLFHLYSNNSYISYEFIIRFAGAEVPRLLKGSIPQSEFSTKTLGDIFNDETPQNNFEYTKNKVTSVSNLSTDNQYPTAKAVYNIAKEVREVAEGKNTTFVLKHDETIPTFTTAGNIAYFDGEKFVEFEDANEYDDWINNHGSLLNNLFNSTNPTVQIITKSYGGSGVNANDDDFLIFRYKKVPEKVSTGYQYLFIEIGQLFNDPVLGIKVGDNIYITNKEVPDRWISNIIYSNAMRIISFDALETQKVPLTDYYTKTESDARYGQLGDDNHFTGSNIFNEITVGSLILDGYIDYSSLGQARFIGENNIYYLTDTYFASGNSSDLGSSSDKWNDLYLSGKLKDGTNEIAISEIARNDLITDEYDNTATYSVGDLVIHNNALYRCTTAISTAEDFDPTKWQITTIKDAFVDLTSAQTVGGIKTFSRNAKFTGGIGASDSYTPNIFARNIWINNALFNGVGSNFGIRVPSTIGLTADKELATTDQAFNVINVADLSLSGTTYTLTDEQFAKMRNGKPTIFIGNVKTQTSNIDSVIFYPSNRVNDTTLFDGICIGNNYNARGFGWCYLYRLTVATKTLSIMTELAKIDTGSNKTSITGLQSGLSLGYSNQSVEIKSKMIPNYPTTNTSPQVLTIGANGGSLSWENHMTEWYGTQAQYDALGTYDSNTIYNILES